MAKKSTMIKPVAAAVGVAFVSSLVISATAVADENPFDATDLDAGYMLAGEGDGEGSCGEGEGSCGEGEGSCGEGEGSCGEGSCGGDKEGEGKDGGEGSCGGDKEGEGSCGGDKEDAEGKCGEGSCGGSV